MDPTSDPDGFHTMRLLFRRMQHRAAAGALHRAASPFAAKYTLLTGTGGCATKTGEVLGVQAFVADPVNPGDGLGSMAIESLDVGTAYSNAADREVMDPDANHQPYALGKFTTFDPGPDHVCAVPTLAPAVLDLPALPPEGDGGAQPAVHVNLQVE